LVLTGVDEAWTIAVSIHIGSNMAAEPKAKGDVMQLRPRSKLKIEY